MAGQRSTSRASLAFGIAFVGALSAADGHAAGAHFGVDDAALLDAGTCQIETW